ncbi:hypothetical protein [Nocardioides convexus]|nr:hypothetical protein [Nocardioides convexus]
MDRHGDPEHPAVALPAPLHRRLHPGPQPAGQRRRWLHQVVRAAG